MNILFIAYSFSPNRGGVQRVTDLLAKQFLNIGHRVSYLFALNEMDDSPEAFPVPCFLMDKPLRESFDMQSIELYHSILLHNKIDIIIHQYPILRKSDFFFKHALPGVMKISCFHGAPFGQLNFVYRQLKTLSLHKKLISLPKYCLQKHLLRNRFIEINKLSDYQCFLASSYANEVSKILPYSKRGKVVFIPNPNTFKIETQSCNEKEDLVLFVGRVSDPVKNLIDFIKIWEKTYALYPTWKALIIGDDSNCKSFKNYIRENHIENITFTGHTNQIAEYYKKAKILCMTSHHEGWPMVLTEAMSYGCVPFVYSTFGAVNDMILNKLTGFTILPYQMQSMVDCMCSIMSSNSDWEVLSRNAKNYVARFSIENVTNTWNHLFLKKNI